MGQITPHRKILLINCKIPKIEKDLTMAWDVLVLIANPAACNELTMLAMIGLLAVRLVNIDSNG